MWNADLMLTGAVEQGQRTSFNFARKGVSAELLRRITRTNPGQRPVFLRHDPDVRRAAQPPRAGTDRSAVSPGPALGILGRREPRHPRRCRRAVEWRVPQRRGQRGDPRSRGRGGLPQDISARLLVQEAARTPGHHLRDPRLGRVGRWLASRNPTNRCGRPANRGPSNRCRRSPGERTVLRGRRHHDPRVRARHRGRTGNDQPPGIPARGKCGAGHERGAADTGLEGARRRALFGWRQRLRARHRLRTGRAARQRRVRRALPTPIGPVRVDLGFKLDRRGIRRTSGTRTALHFSIGQAF